MLNKKKQAKLDLKAKSFVVNRINNKEEELNLEKSVLLKKKEKLLNKKEQIEMDLKERAL